MNEGTRAAAVRRTRLEAILAEAPDAEPPPAGEVPRFAAMTSEGPPEAALGAAATLLLAPDRAALADRLREELGEGRLAHGRVWDLDLEVFPWGNLAVGYEVRIGEELIRPVHAVSVEGTGGRLYLFADQLDAEAFCRAVRRRDGEAQITRELLHDNSGADRLIDAERGD